MKINIEWPEEGKLLWEGHRERLRRRMEREGWDALKPHEMVELALYHAVPRQDLSDVSRLLVDRFGTVGGVFAASRAQLESVPGVTSALAEWIRLTGELIFAYQSLQNEEDIRLGCYQEVTDFLKPRMGRLGPSELWVLYADFRFNLITYTEIAGGPAWWDAANVRRMMAEAIGNGARYVYLVLAREDASEGMAPGESDRLAAIAATLRSADLDLVDCLLAGGGAFYSMNIHGKLTSIQPDFPHTALHERYAGGGVND